VGGQHQRNHQHAALDRHQHPDPGRQHLVDQRPRFVEFDKDGSQLWASAEIGGTVTILDVATRQVLKP
jgi:hypothetical protein